MNFIKTNQLTAIKTQTVIYNAHHSHPRNYGIFLLQTSNKQKDLEKHLFSGLAKQLPLPQKPSANNRKNEAQNRHTAALTH